MTEAELAAVKARHALTEASRGAIPTPPNVADVAWANAALTSLVPFATAARASLADVPALVAEVERLTQEREADSSATTRHSVEWANELFALRAEVERLRSLLHDAGIDTQPKGP